MEWFFLWLIWAELGNKNSEQVVKSEPEIKVKPVERKPSIAFAFLPLTFLILIGGAEFFQTVFALVMITLLSLMALVISDIIKFKF